MRTERVGLLKEFHTWIEDHHSMASIRRVSLDILDISSRISGAERPLLPQDQALLAILRHTRCLLREHEENLRKLLRAETRLDHERNANIEFTGSVLLPSAPSGFGREHPLFQPLATEDRSAEDVVDQVGLPVAAKADDAGEVDSELSLAPATNLLIEASNPKVEDESIKAPEPWKPDAKCYKTWIEILDLLEKGRNDERMGHDRLLRSLSRYQDDLVASFGGVASLGSISSGDRAPEAEIHPAKTLLGDFLSLLSQAGTVTPALFLERISLLGERISLTLGMERIDRLGPFDVTDQHILSMVPTEDPVLDQTIEGTVECGYRVGEWVLRTQKVFVYQLNTSSMGAVELVAPDVNPANSGSQQAIHSPALQSAGDPS